MARMILLSTAFVAGVLVALIYFDVQDQVLRLLMWIDGYGPTGALLFILIMALAVVLLLPGIMLTTGAGFAFGVVEGSVYVVLGTTLGATVAFLLARHGLGHRAARFFLRHEKLKVISDEFASEGWKIVLMTRLIPFFPFKLSNYAFGLTRFSLRGFVGGTFVGEIPLSVHNVYLGSIAADLATLGQRNTERTSLEWMLYGAGFLVTVLTVIYLGALARRALSRYVDSFDASGREDALA